MTEKLAIEFMTDLFSIIKAKKRDIAEIEKIIRIDFEKNVILPKFKIVPWEFAVKFEWWKTGNQNPSTAIWHPEEMSLETFYNKKLKRTFKLL